LACFVVASENPTSTEFCTWDIVFATTAPSFTSTFASTLSGAVLSQELVDLNIEQERSDLNLRQMSNQMQQVLEGVGDFHQLSFKSWLCSVRAE